jgi:heme/copper-type cytochrome/quinol oxidase subunit 2
LVFFGEEEGSPEGFYRVCGGEVVGGPYGDSRETGSQASEKPVQETREIPTVVTALGLLIAVILMVVGFRFRARQAAEAEKAHAAIPHHDRLNLGIPGSSCELRAMFVLATAPRLTVEFTSLMSRIC